MVICIFFINFALYFMRASMVILNIETSTDACSVALTEGGKVLEMAGDKLCRIEKTKSEHARQLAVFTDELLGKLRSSGKKVDVVAVSAGPGSYTGLRIGASTAKGLAYGLGVKMVAVPTLAILAEHARKALGAENLAESDGMKIRPMLDARRMEVYTQLFDKEGKALTEVEAKVVDETSFADEMGQNEVLFLGNGAGKCKTVLTSAHARFLDDVAVDAADMGSLAEELVKREEFADVAYWTPFYLKEFEAKKSVVKGLKS